MNVFALDYFTFGMRAAVDFNLESAGVLKAYLAYAMAYGGQPMAAYTMRSHPRTHKKKGSSDRRQGDGSSRRGTRKRRNSRKKKRSESSDSKDGEEESSKPTSEDRPPMQFFGDEQTRWSIVSSDADPIYIRDCDSSSFVPLPKAEADSRPAPDPRVEEHFIGVRSSEEAGKMVKPDDFVLYYKKEDDEELEIAIPLYLAHRNTRNKLFHFPVVRSAEENGARWWQVQISSFMNQSFRQLSDLVRCYHIYRFTDAQSGRMEVFPLWKGGILDDYK
nr:Hypothetical protein CBG21946 [Haemonchus contortus]